MPTYLSYFTFDSSPSFHPSLTFSGLVSIEYIYTSILWTFCTSSGIIISLLLYFKLLSIYLGRYLSQRYCPMYEASSSPFLQECPYHFVYISVRVIIIIYYIYWLCVCFPLLLPCPSIRQWISHVIYSVNICWIINPTELLFLKLPLGTFWGRRRRVAILAVVLLGQT